MKKCSSKKCLSQGILLSLDCFSIDKSHTDGLASQCKKCRNSKCSRFNSKIYMAQAHIKEKKRQYDKNRKVLLKNNVNYILRHNLRSRISSVLKRNQKSGSAVKDLGCSIDFLKQYFEEKFYNNPRTGEEMTWENYGYYGWHIDHIVPLASFDLTNREEFLKACHYTNLQPLWREENMTKWKNIGELNV